MHSAYLTGSFRISVKNNTSYDSSKTLDLHGVLQGRSILPLSDICGDSSMGDLCYCHYFINEAEAQNKLLINYGQWQN